MSEPRSDLPTHRVENQPTALGDRDLWATDPVLSSLVPETDGLRAYARTLGQTDCAEHAKAANRHSPELRLFDAGGRRLDEVIFYPSYHRMMALSQEAGYAAVAWDGGSHTEHAAMVYLASQVEPGHCCPLTMTYAAVPALQQDSGLAADWVPKLTARHYDPRPLPIGQKRSATLGMAMTEKQGGSDVRANTTTAQRDGDAWRLRGHKWFCSAPMSDGFLTLAQAPGGLTCFLVPRWLEGQRNAIHLMRLKDKLGNRSNASAEIEYHDALAYPLGEEGRGVQTIIEMVHHTRLDTCVAPAGLMRAALAQAIHWARHRRAFQKHLIDQPLMRVVLSDLILDWHGATHLAFAAARAFDRNSEADRAFARVSVALAKYLNNKLCPRVIVEAMEVLGGMGYVDDTALPLLYREAPLNGIWEGSGNVICLDILRTLTRVPLAIESLDAALRAATGANRGFDSTLAIYQNRWTRLPTEAEARFFVEQTAHLLTAAELLQRGTPEVADAYIATRIEQKRGQTVGSVEHFDTKAIIDSFYAN